ncbi:B3 domain-containing protein At5g60140-like [Solanum stenotomum]|uniref:B3 domain-containing protein At5g60140-like n=1 Tax=Solanum stenotomum TaxID=172797 RepID=UPI0020D14004|nr:B3 domain-containing protein At5g60140-like [Solanum stenotomum]
MEKGFFKVFIPEISTKRLKLPTSCTDYKNGILPRNIFLRDWFGNLWPIGVTKSGKDIYFEYGWEKFIEDNIVELGDFFIFYYDGTRFFYFKLFERNGCEKKGVGGLKHVVKEEEAEEMNVEHQKNVEPKMNTRARDSNNISCSDVRDENNMVEEKDDEDKECEKTAEVPEEDVDKEEEKQEEEDDDDDNDEYKEEEEEKERTGIFNKMTPRSKAKCKSAIAGKGKNLHDQFATDIFRIGRATKPKNSYFVTKIHPNRRNHLYVLTDVVRNYQLELPSSMTIRDSAGREFEAKLKIWQDDRIWLIGGWHSLSKWNFVEKNDKCICEFVGEKYIKGLYLQVHVVHEGEGFHSNEK